MARGEIEEHQLDSFKPTVQHGFYGIGHICRLVHPRLHGT